MSDVDTASLIHKLQTFALGEDGDAMSDNQVAAAVALLDRVLPDLHHVDLTMPADRPFSMVLANTSGAKTEAERPAATPRRK
jgi:hypothetical protein